MYAVARLNTYDLDKLTAAGDSLTDFDIAHASQPGYLGSLVVDLQHGQRLILNLWQSEEHSVAARAALGSQIGRAINPLLTQPSHFLGSGSVLSADLHRIPDMTLPRS